MSSIVSLFPAISTSYLLCFCLFLCAISSFCLLSSLSTALHITSYVTHFHPVITAFFRFSLLTFCHFLFFYSSAPDTCDHYTCPYNMYARNVNQSVCLPPSLGGCGQSDCCGECASACNGHSSTCDQTSNGFITCRNCLGNTIGAHCEMCDNLHAGTPCQLCTYSPPKDPSPGNASAWENVMYMCHINPNTANKNETFKRTVVPLGEVAKHVAHGDTQPGIFTYYGGVLYKLDCMCGMIKAPEGKSWTNK